MANWIYKISWGKRLREAIEDEDVELVIKCLIACYRELLNKLSDEDKEWKQFDIEDAIFNLENFDEGEEVDEYLEWFYDFCDEIGAWVEV